MRKKEEEIVELKPSCFAFSQKNNCTICLALNLKRMNCHNCKFFKTKAEYDKNVAPLEYKNF